MDVEAERVVPPDDVAEDLVVPAVVRRVDDPLLLPGAPRVRAGGAERDAEPVGELDELLAPLAHARGRLGERLAAAGPHLDLGGDQLADEVLLELGARAAAWSSSKRLTRASVSGSRIANSSSTATVKSRAAVERLARRSDQLVRAELLVAHRRRSRRKRVRAGASATLAQHQRSSTAARARRALGAPPGERRAARVELGREVVGVAGRRSARCGARAGTRPRARRRSRRGPEWRATSGGDPPAAASAATMPKASGKIDGDDGDVGERIRWTRWRCSSGPVKSVRGPAIASSSSR